MSAEYIVSNYIHRAMTLLDSEQESSITWCKSQPTQMSTLVAALMLMITELHPPIFHDDR